MAGMLQTLGNIATEVVVTQEALKTVIGKIQDVHASLDDDGKKILVALLEQAKRGNEGEDSSLQEAMEFAPGRTVMLSAARSSGACW
jgi:hypothetical protein